MFFNHNTLLSLFDCFVGSVINYASEVWGSLKAPNIEKLHLNFCKYILGVKRSTCNVAVYSELGRCPLLYQRMFNIVKFWKKILYHNNCIIQHCYYTLYDCVEKHNAKNW